MPDMNYKFSLTPRLISLAIFSAIALMVLLFALGYQVGKSSAPAPQVEGRLVDQAEQRAERRLEQRLGATTAPLAAPVRELQKAAP